MIRENSLQNLRDTFWVLLVSIGGAIASSALVAGLVLMLKGS